jgi:hypothetical protein
VPTPIGPPPSPPTATPTATPPPPPTSTPSPTSAGGSPTPTPTATQSPVAASLNFSLDAARVSKVNDPGDLRGLASIKPGSTVWLMLYYTVGHLPKKMKRVTTYQVLFKGKVVYKVTYASTAKPSELGRFSRYTPYTASASLPFGSYVFRATLAFGKRSQNTHWNFSIGRQIRQAGSHRN